MVRVTRGIFFLPFILVSVQAFSQVCNCNTILKATISGIEDNYAGYFDKVGPSGSTAYDKLKTQLLNQSSGRSFDFACMRLLYDYIDYFNDRHISLRRITNDIEAKSFWRNFFSAIQKYPLDTASLKKEQLQSKDSIEGCWTNESGTINVIISRTQPHNYEGTVIKGDSILWFPFHRKFTFNSIDQQAIFYNSVHIPRKTSVSIFDGEIVFGSYGRFRKYYPDNRDKALTHKSLGVVPYGDSIAYIRLPSFEIEHRTAIDSLISVNSRLLDRAKFLIIDMIDNTGGSVLCYEKLLPYVLGESYIRFGSKLRSSMGNSHYYRKVSMDTTIPANIRKWYGQKAAAMADSTDQRFISSSDNAQMVNSKYRKLPERIFFLVNGKTASASEILLGLARQNKKCVLIGRETAGLTDYINVNSEYELPCRFLLLSYPTGRSNVNDAPGHSPGNGFTPDFKLDLNTDKWVEYVIQHFIVKNQRLAAK